MGANGVIVNGTTYDVRFGDGALGNNISTILGGYTNATAASLALGSQVFTDSSLGNFDSNPSLTNGCSTYVCATLTVWGGESGWAYAKQLSNWDVETNDSKSSANLSDLSTYNTGTASNNTWQNIATWYAAGSAPAVVSTPSAVPVPAAAWLFGSGLVGLAGLRRRKQTV